MAQSKSSPSGKPGRSSGGSSRPGGKPGSARSGAAKAGASKPTTKATAPGTPPRKKKPKSIVNQKQTPWGLIITTVVIVLFAVGVVAVVVATKKDDSGGGSVTATNGGQPVDTTGKDRYRQPELPAAAAIKGVTYRVEGQAVHVEGRIKYDNTPPIGGKHNIYWADCTGTVYPKAIANENAVHMLEHGAVWITYNADKIKGAALDTLKKYVEGQNYIAMSPYPGLAEPISLQSWGYQLKLTNPSDPRIAQFIKVLKQNQTTTPEPGSPCSQPTFKADPSTFGNPKNQP